ncbi:hypothetical protein B0H11DRAFT_2312438 [Mycena galericulata]|nr:hypothetical protein B0H11DRAFT_2312438 [Mycena galericulata]
MDVDLLSLPNEILLVIFSHFADPYPLYPLSTLCRRLHFLALPIYLSRTGEFCNITVGAEETHTLAALQTSLFLSTILADFTACVLNLREKYFNDVVRALNVVLEKSCTTLTVDDARPSDTTPVSRVSRRTRGVHQSPTVGLLTSSISLSPFALRQRKLSTFKIHSDILLSPHCRAWTLDVLNSFPLTYLSIDTPFVSSDVWDPLLSQTEIPTLSDLCILKCRIKPARLHAFLTRHPGVTTLLLGDVFVPSYQERLPQGHLPQLSTLSATAAQVAYLLQALDHTAALRTVRVLTHMTRLDLIFTDTSLRSVASRLAPVALSLVLPVPLNLPRVAVELNLDFGDDTALKYVSALEFVFEGVNVAFFKLSDYLSVTKWFAPFLGLKTVALSRFDDGYNTALMLEAIQMRAPQVERLIVNGAVHDLTSVRVPGVS